MAFRAVRLVPDLVRILWCAATGAARLSLLTILAIAALAALVCARVMLPGLVLLASLAAAVALPAWHGKPASARFLTPAVQREVKIPLTSQAIIRALSVLGIGSLSMALAEHPDRIWRSGIVAVRGGHKVAIQLPPGTVAGDLLAHEQRMAAALGRQADCVVVEPAGEDPAVT